MKILKGDAQELKRVLGEINRVQDYLKYLESGRDATLFLLSWHQYLQAKAELPLIPLSSPINGTKDSPDAPIQVEIHLGHVHKVSAYTLRVYV